MHMKVRLKTAASTASCDNRFVAFAFDAIANSSMGSRDTRIVLNRGFAESMGNSGLRARNEGDDFYTDTIDNRQVVHNLCSTEKPNDALYHVIL